MRSTFLVLLLVFSVGTLAAQTAKKSFDVASVKPGAAGQGNPFGFSCHGVDGTMPENPRNPAALGRCSGLANFKSLISNLYDVAYENVSGGPAWVDAVSEGLQIDAVAENPATATLADLKEMMRSLLAERLKLKLRRLTKEMQGFSLVVDKDGSKMKNAAPDSRIVIGGGINPDRSRKIWGTMSMSDLAKALALPVGGPVIDKTDLTGVYEFTLSYPPPTRPGGGGDYTGPTIFTTIHEQLGLRLESAPKVAVPIVVIESAEKPGGRH